MKKLLFLIVMTLLPVVSFADPVEIDGLYYNLLSKANIAEVVIKPGLTWSDYYGDIVIPEVVRYEDVDYKVTSIGEHAFWADAGLTSIKLPKGLLSIGKGAFEGCSNLTSVEIPDSVEIIQDYAFSGCTKITSMTIPSKVSILNWGVFSSCSSLESVILPDGLEKILSNAFMNCTSLKSIKLPDNITKIEYRAFQGCNSLVSINIPSKVTFLESSTFKNCTALTSIILPDNIEYILDSAFEGCSNLVTVTIGVGLRKLGEKAFSNCVELKDVYCYTLKVPSSSAADAFDGSYVEYATLHVAEASISSYRSTKPWSNFKEIVKADMPKYKLKYIVDDVDYKEYEVEYGSTIIPEEAPTKEGYTFSGWSTIPKTMPAKDVTVTGTFSINIYKLTYMVDGVEYKSYDVEYGATITPEPAPIKEGYTFSGWSDIPEKMPANDLTVTGTFSVNKYKLTYMVDGAEYKSYDIEYGAAITPEPAPIKEGYTFSGWSDIPEKMPANDLTVTGTFSVNKYKLTYMVDGAEYKSYDIEYGATITPEPAPTKDGYTFSGWSDIPETMPANDVTITGTFSAIIVTKYTLTYKVDGEVYKTYELEEGTAITPEPTPTKEGYTFSGWSDIPETMPANDVTVTGTFSINKYKLIYMVDGAEYKSYDVEYGAAITPEEAPTKEGYTFSGWSDIPETMPAKDVVVTGSFSAIEIKEDTGEFTATSGSTAELSNDKNVSGEYEIPETVTHDGVTYTVTSIGNEAFKDNTNLTDVTIPSTITSIGESAFAGCSNLKSITVNSTTPIAFPSASRTRGGSSIFEGVDKNTCILYVPEGSVELYKAAPVWSEFQNILSIGSTGINGIIHNGEPQDIYDLKGRKVKAKVTSLEGLPRGIYIINGKKIIK